MEIMPEVYNETEGILRDLFYFYIRFLWSLKEDQEEKFARTTLDLDPAVLQALIATHPRTPKPILLTPDLKQVVANPAFEVSLGSLELTAKIKALEARLAKIEEKVK